jgi:hypothetical protein
VKPFFVTVGIILLGIGLVSFLVPVPQFHREAAGREISRVGVTKERREKMPVGVGAALVVVGTGLIIAGKKRRDRPRIGLFQYEELQSISPKKRT